MARGWESKSVESQQHDARVEASKIPAPTPAQRDRAQQRTSLELALTRTQAELQAATHAAHRDMLHMKLEALRARLDELK